MSLPFYFQSHDGIVGLTDSHQKWERLQVPDNLTNQSVLDIGCNEGRMTNWFAERGAAMVVGIDSDETRIDFARRRYGSDSIQFLAQPWSILPDGPFDLVLWANAMHYEKDPKSVLDSIRQRLKPGGLLILECGYLVQPGLALVSIARHQGHNVALHPTYEYLTEVLLRDFLIQQVAGPELASIQQGAEPEAASIRRATGLDIAPGAIDPVPRGVFHCRPRVSEVMFVTGSGPGRSDLARSLGRAADKVVSVQDQISRIAVTQYAPAFLAEGFVDWLSQLCLGSNGLVVIEGDLTEETIRLFMKRNPQHRTWVTRMPE